MDHPQIIKSKNHQIKGENNRPTLLDVYYKNDGINKPVIIFSHGFKGFKDWGHFNLLAEAFAKAGFVFVKFNFSHNGGTVDQPIDFPDLEAFGNNNYTKELNDLGRVIDWVFDNDVIPEDEFDPEKLYLTGHSRGGGITILKAAEDKRVKKISTWAAVSDYFERLPDTDTLEFWKENEVMYIKNGRTNQDMPQYYQFVENLFENRDRLDIPKAEKNLDIPHLIIHGDTDGAVDVKAAKKLKEYNPEAEVYIIESTGHTFDGKHPYEKEELPKGVGKLLERTLAFFKD